MEDSCRADPQREAELEKLQGPGYCSVLLQVAGAESAACVDSVRVLAMICLRNCIRSSWTPRKGIQRKGGRKRKFVIPEDEKKDVKRVLLSAIVAEPQAHLGKPILKQIIAAIQQIAGKDWPERWPTLLETLGQVCCATFAPAPLECLNKVLRLLLRAICRLRTLPSLLSGRDSIHSWSIAATHAWLPWKVGTDPAF